jgi:peptidoglycan hydrolase CwlO-like protein
MELDFQQELKKMEERLDELEVKIDSIDSKLSRVMDALVGNPILKSDGLVGKFDTYDTELKRIEKEILELKDFKKRILYGVAAIVSVGLILDAFIRAYANLKK